MKKVNLFLIIFSLGLVPTVSTLNPTPVNAKSKYPTTYRRINNLKWKHPYNGSNDVTIKNEKHQNILMFSGQGLMDEKYKNYIKTPSLPKSIRGHWYISRKSHFNIGKKGLSKTLIFGKKDPTDKYFNLNKQRYSTSQFTYFTYYHHPRKTQKSYSFSAHNFRAGMYGYISSDMLPITIKDSSGKKHSALAIEYSHNNRTTYKVAYHKYHAKLPHHIALLYYEDLFGSWPSSTSERVYFGKAVSVSALKRDTLQSLAHEDGTIDFLGGGDQVIQYLTKVDKKSLTPEVISTLKSY